MGKQERNPAPLTTKPSITLADMMQRFKTDDDCKAYIRDCRWPDGVVRCPRCKSDKVYELKARPFHWQCRACQKNGYRFSVITRTVFENTKYPLRAWFQVAYVMSQSREGVSALQIHRQIGSGSYETAWYLCTRIRSAMRGGVLPLEGEVEVDETHVGGLETNKHLSKRLGMKGAAAAKATVIGAISRKGNVVCQAVENTSAETFERFVEQVVAEPQKVRLLATDEHGGYRYLRNFGYPHKTVSHGEHKYVVGTVHTNTIESFWSLLKRGVVGTYHHVRKEYLPLYLNEFSFRFNERKNPDIFGEIIRSA